MTAVLPLLKAIWPFLQEYVLNGKTVKESWKTNKKKVVLLCMLMGLIGLIGLSFSHIQHLTKEIATLKDSYEGRAYRSMKHERDDLKEERDELLKQIKEWTNNPGNSNPNSGTVPNDSDQGPVNSAAPRPVPPPKNPSPPTVDPVIPNPNREDYDRVKNYQDFLDGLNR